jgi:hypothetical protein
VAALLIALIYPAAGWAQTRSEIVGTIKDHTGLALPGVTVALASPNMVGGARTTVTSDVGSYRFSDLPLGTYELDATLQGFQTTKRSGLQVAFGTTVTVDLVMQVGAVSETITVTGDTPVIDIKTAASTTVIEESFLESLPAAGRSARPNEIMSLAPGVTTNRTAHGGQRDANNIMVDGMPSSIQGGGNIRTSVLNYNWMQEVQVVALGASAEYGEFTGTVSNMIMRSGSNQFSGMLDYFTTQASWLGDNTGSLSPTLQARFKPAEIVSNWDTTYQVGGPIMKDKLFFFAGGEYYRLSTVTAGAQPGPDGKPVPNNEHWPRYIAKVNWAISDNVKLEGFVEHDNDTIDPYGTSTVNTVSAMYSGFIPKTMFNGRFTWAINDKTLLEVRGGALKLKSSFIPVTSYTAAGPYPRKDTITGLTTVNYTGVSTSEQPRTSVTGSLTRWVNGHLGKSHELKLGLEYEHTELNNWSAIPGGKLYTDNNGVPSQVAIQDVAGTTQSATSLRTSVYVQDSWTLTDRVTLQPGIRFSAERGDIPGTSGIFSVKPVDLRIGFAWDIEGNHRTLLRGHFGRFHEGVTPGTFIAGDGSHFSPTITYRIAADGSLTQLSQTAAPSAVTVDSNVKQAYMDQWTLAFERELFPDFGVTVQYVRRDWASLLAYVDSYGQWGKVQQRDPGPDNTLGTADDGAMIDVYNLLNPPFKPALMLTNPSDATRYYKAFMLIAKKRFSHNWQMMASYTRSDAAGQVNNAGGNTVATGVDVGTTGLWTNPNLKINAYGPGQYDAPNQFMLNGTYRIVKLGGVNVSGTYRYADGQAWGRTATIRGLAQGNQTVRIETRGTQPADALNMFDLRVEKTFSLGSPRHVLGLYVDIFNILNKGYALAFTEASGASFGVPASWATARQYQAGARFSF